MALIFPASGDPIRIQELTARLQGLKVAIIAAGAGQEGGAERFNGGLVGGFEALGANVELIIIDANEATTADIVQNYARAKSLDLSAFDLVISTKVPSYAIDHPHHVLYLVHTVRVFDDMFDTAFEYPGINQFSDRALVHQLDFEALKKIPHRFAIGCEVQRRLYRWRGLECDVLHPPLLANPFKVIEGEDLARFQAHSNPYFFIAGRLHPWKRLDLLIKAVQHCPLPIRLVIAGVGEAQADLQKLAASDPRIEFLGRISDAELVEYYAHALAVPFLPLREDYGYITLEAFASARPVITCVDSGEPAHIVENLRTGLVVEPTVQAVADALTWAYEHPEQMNSMGQLAHQELANLSWPAVALTLASAGLNFPITLSDKSTQKNTVLVMDMQPIDPPIGGGRQRLLGLYHGLGAQIECRYIGSYDWPGESFREHALSNSLTEINIPLSAEHYQAAQALAKQVGGTIVIDLAFSQQAHLSPEYLEAVRQAIPQAQVLVFSHPWAYPLVQDRIRADQVVIYDAQNVEGYLRTQLLGVKSDICKSLVLQVCADELALGQRANWILTCSHEDLQRFFRVYGFAPAKMRVIPNGVMAYSPSRQLRKEKCRQVLGIDPQTFLAIFVGSQYGPNAEAALFILHDLAPAMPQMQFVIAGGVSTQLSSTLSNVVLTGALSEEQKDNWLGASDVALNPMFSGSGTNIKMFDFMASRLPVVTTEVGARGIETSYRLAMHIVDPTVTAFESALKELSDPLYRARAASEARACVEEGYAWEHISAQLGQLMMMRAKIAGQSLPKFSVIIPSYERPHQLEVLIEHLQVQIERDFEVIVIDQSASPWNGSQQEFGFPLTYFHTPIKGAVRARNTGALLAQGDLLAFIDDDCLPSPTWLLNARSYFVDAQVVGLEGLISSDHMNDPNWRPVSNVGSEGIGFMTANLMVRSAVFQYLGGFDLRFDRPHFREDTDFGWRMLDLGLVPYAEDVAVFHPAQPRDIERESHKARAHFFEKDALLFQKHPERYKVLFEFERHYERSVGFAQYLLRGFEQIGKKPPSWIVKKLHSVKAS
jgi:glycosyltransferase involved in cell wall biosynthesis